MNLFSVWILAPSHGGWNGKSQGKAKRFPWLDLTSVPSELHGRYDIIEFKLSLIAWLFGSSPPERLPPIKAVLELFVDANGVIDSTN